MIMKLIERNQRNRRLKHRQHWLYSAGTWADLEYRWTVYAFEESHGYAYGTFC